MFFPAVKKNSIESIKINSLYLYNLKHKKTGVLPPVCLMYEEPLNIATQKLLPLTKLLNLVYFKNKHLSLLFTQKIKHLISYNTINYSVSPSSSPLCAILSIPMR